VDLITKEPKTIDVRDYDFTFIGGVHISFTLPRTTLVVETPTEFLISAAKMEKRLWKAHLLFVETFDRQQIVADPLRPSPHALTPNTQS
jgi:hypothetical protein